MILFDVRPVIPTRVLLLAMMFLTGIFGYIAQVPFSILSLLS